MTTNFYLQDPLFLIPLPAPLFSLLGLVWGFCLFFFFHFNVLNYKASCCTVRFLLIGQHTFQGALLGLE